ncbi:hypothetical protein BGZ61DRAFT_540964 [Ilyonectria robusta]|uniref:uncharacterized protein n=1 Tax=Ilyonectria robusta TaxID=1079257 RepID=UPI001E8D1F79|nr:uncharacterized protein BGZ61DRAFT_540964 [Ilyonectria robusta]KAH8656391.1 hypothetical protein BGZ61DRAFT_540964 [Ilyonectria robusta]
MKYSAALSVLTLAVAALAAPANVEGRDSGHGGGKGGDTNIAAATGSSAYCCNTESNGSLISLNLLDCLKL